MSFCNGNLKATLIQVKQEATIICPMCNGEIKLKTNNGNKLDDINDGLNNLLTGFDD